MTPREAWAKSIIAEARRHGTIPRYGDPDWEALPPSHILAVAAVVIAAEAWVAEGDPDRFHAALTDELRLVREQREREEHAEWTDTARRLRVIGAGPSHVDLQRIRQGGDAP